MRNLNVIVPSTLIAIHRDTLWISAKLVGYQPSYKFKPKTTQAKAQVNQTTSINIASDTSLSSLTTSQCKPLIVFLSSQPQLSSPDTFNPQQPEPSVSCFRGIISLSSTISFFSFYVPSWVLDISVAHHVCCFTSNVVARNSSITLPNGHSVSISRIGSIKLFEGFTLNNVLFVP